MRRSLSILAVLFVAMGPLVARSHAQTVVTGKTAGGAFYMIAVPAPWNGDLVIWNHGFDLSPVEPLVPEDLGPLAALQLAEGYAVAASSYQQSGWALFKTKNDLQHLVNVFKRRFGRPDEVIVTGGSLGGIVTAEAIEDANIGNVTGAYAVCGAMAGSRNWDGALDFRLTYDAVCSSVPGGSIPGGARGLPRGSRLTGTDIAFAANACLGILTPGFRTPEQSARLAAFLAETDVPESFVLTVLGYTTFGMSDLVHDKEKLHRKIGVGNIGVVYEDPVVDGAIARIAPNPGAANRLAKSYTPTGNVGATKIVTLHTDKDGLVIVENQSEYASVVPAANLTTAIVVEAKPTHCGFTAAELVAGWESLRAWLAGASKPTAASIQATCAAIAPGLGGGPCRIDPSFVVPNMDGRIAPR